MKLSDKLALVAFAIMVAALCVITWHDALWWFPYGGVNLDF
jgi:hypothetical protein